MTIFGYPILKVIGCLSGHFLSGFVLGVLAYWLTATMLSHITQKGCPEGFSIRGFSLLVALSFSVLSHIALDYTWCPF